ncbi:MAG: DUF3298 and DUF4163 domain-containing protein [Acidobacteriota bacterium]|nr:DUF3298 and DUF4163 domain-containing protein [Acidobacteriota bacterium]
MKYSKVIIGLSLFIFLAGCKLNNSATEQSGNTSAPAREYQHAEGGTTPAGETKYFKGSIGSALGLQMKLVREGETITGSYFYQKVGTKIDTRGTIDKDGNVVLEEFDPKGKQTGVFKGIWKTDENGLIEVAGNWNKPNSDKKTAFSLHEEPIEFSGGVEIVTRQIKENNKKLKYEIDAGYPQLSGSVNPNFEKFNQTVRSLVTRKVSDFKKEMASIAEEQTTSESPAESMGSDLGVTYAVALAKDDLISIQFEVSSYESGAAHPNSYSEVVNFDLKIGKSIKVSDVFRPGSKYLQTISAYCIADLKKQAKQQGSDAMLDDDWIQRGAAAEASNYASWTISKKGLGITFDSYQVAAYAAGPQHVLVPYSALKEIIKPDGPVGQFVK